MRDEVLNRPDVIVALAGGALATASAFARRPRLAVTVLLLTGAVVVLVPERPRAFTTLEGVLDDDPPPTPSVPHDPATDLEPGQE
jgi:hypothetical protein